MPPLKLNEFKLKRVHKFKYLGQYLMGDQKDIDRERRAVSIKGNMLARKYARCSDEVKLPLFKPHCQNLWGN